MCVGPPRSLNWNGTPRLGDLRFAQFAIGNPVVEISHNSTWGPRIGQSASTGFENSETEAEKEERESNQAPG